MATIQRDINSFTATIERNGNTFNVTVERTTTPISVTITRKSGEDGEIGPQGPQGPAGPNQVSTTTDTNITGILKGAAGKVAQAVAGTDYAAASHSHAIGDVTGLQTALDGKAATSHTHDDRYYTESETDTLLSGKANTSHNHSIADVTNLQTTLDGKAATSHTHNLSQITDAGTAASRNAPASGDATSTQVVLGNDTRLTNSRTPSAVNSGVSTNMNGLVAGNGSTLYVPTPQQAQPLVIPSLTTVQRDALGVPATGYTIFNTTEGYLEYYDSFWGWMPVNANDNLRARYGVDIFDPLGQQQFSTLYHLRSSGTGSNLSADNDSASPYGVFRGATGSTSTGHFFLHSQAAGGNPGILLSAGIQQHSIVTKMPSALSTAGNEYVFVFGYGDRVDTTQSSHAAIITYDLFGALHGTTASANYQCVTRSSGVSTRTTTSKTVVLSEVVRLSVLVLSGQVQFYINDSLVATHDTNIPDNRVRLVWGVIKRVGTTSVQAFCFSARYRNKFNSPTW